MKKLPLLLLAFAAVRLAAASPGFPQDHSDLPPDPAAHFGTLPNGLRYVILPNRMPADRVSLRLLVLNGSLEERDNQRGLAHYLEHMAFNGSTHYAPETLVKYFQRMGMNFGGDTNAHTGFDRTVYQINLPHADDATVAEGLQVFSDFAGGLLLTPAMVDKERPIILSEKRTGDSVGFREQIGFLKFILADSLFARRIVIGEKSDIDAATREQFLDIYNTWYRPERMAVVVVGQVDPARIEPLITKAFSGLRDRGPAGPDPDLGHVTAALGLKVHYDFEAEAPLTELQLDVLAPYAFAGDTRAVRKAHLVRGLAMAMLNRRLEILSKQPGAPFLTAGAGVSENFNFFRESTVQVECAPDHWQASLAVAEQELRRALQFGFTTGELREAVANARDSLKRAADSAATRRSETLAEQMANELALQIVPTSPAQNLALGAPVLDQVTPEDCAAALRYAFGTPGRYLSVMGNAKIDGDAEAAIVQAYQASAAVAVQPPAAAADQTFAYTDFGPAGKIAERHHVDDLDITQAVFANGVRVNLKRTDFEAQHLRICVRIGGGQLTVPRDHPGLDTYSGLTFSQGGLGKHSFDDLRRILAGKQVAVSLQPSADALLLLSGATTPDNLLLELQLLAAHVTDPGYRPEAGRLASKYLDAVYNQIERVPQGPLQAEVPRLLADGDPRFGLPARAGARTLTLEQEKAWLAPQLATGAIEVSVVGDFDVEAALGCLARTFGALPPRAPKPAYDAERQVRFPAQPFAKDYVIDSQIPKAAVALYWPTTDARDIGRGRRLILLGAIFSDRLRIKVREQLGDAYGVSAGSAAGETYPGYGDMQAITIVAPEKTGAVTDAILAVAADLHDHGVTADDLERAKKPALTAIRDSARTNPYWLRSVLASSQEFPRHLDWARTRESDIEAVTTDELSALAKAYLDPSRAFKVTVKPKAPASAPPGEG